MRRDIPEMGAVYYLKWEILRVSAKPTYQELEKRIRQLEQELQKGEDKFRILLDESSDPIFSFFPDGTYRFVNHAFAEGVGKSVDEIIGHPIWDIFPGEEGDKRFSVVKDVFATGESKTIEVRVPSPGSDQYYITTVKAARDDHGKVISVVCSSKNITDRKQTEEMLRESEERHRLFFENAPIGILHYSNRGIITTVNDAMVTIFGSSREKLIGLGVDEIPNKEFAGEVYKSLNGETGFFEGEYCSYTGNKTSFIKATWVPIKQKNEIVAGVGIVEDITERKQAEEALHASEGKFRTLVEKSPLGISLIANDGRYKYFNPQFATIFGYTIEDIPTGVAWFKKAFPDEANRQKAIRTWIEDLEQINPGQARPRIFTVTCKDGTRKKIHFRSVTMENRDQLVIYEDITEKSSLEQQLLQAQKFEAIGTLAGGIAHDFNNLLMGIQGRSSLISVTMGPSNSHMEHIKAIEECIQRATGLTKQLLGFARRGKYEVNPINFCELVQNSATMFSRTRKEIDIHTKMWASPLVVEADRGQIEQVLLNMYVNAWQAMPDGGELYIETSAVVLDEYYCKPYQAEPGRYAKVSVTDTGIGMSENTRRRIFDPFFTTKEKSRGTGLGLASSYGIIKNHGGIITVYSQRNHGTTFNIYLQLSQKEIHQEMESEGAVVKGSETILLVDDEDMIIDVGLAMLKKLGYRVITAQSGFEAIEKIKDLGNEIDLVILDLIMPGMDGGKTFHRIREIHPRIPVLLCSGYAVNGQAKEILRKGCNGFIQKPFNITELSQKIRGIVEAAKDDG
jgi:two-component system, cell cycle sensor histidine kinase and response regulator CckA